MNLLGLLAIRCSRRKNMYTVSRRNLVKLRLSRHFIGIIYFYYCYYILILLISAAFIGYGWSSLKSNIEELYWRYNGITNLRWIFN